MVRLPVVPATIRIYDGPYAGVEIEIDAGLPPLVRFALIGAMIAPETETPAELADRSSELMRLLAEDVILGWNVDDRRGRPIPMTVEGLVSVPPDLVAEIIARVLGNAWTEEVGDDDG